MKYSRVGSEARWTYVTSVVNMNKGIDSFIFYVSKEKNKAEREKDVKRSRRRFEH